MYNYVSGWNDIHMHSRGEWAIEGKGINCPDYTVSLIVGPKDTLFTWLMGTCACSSKKHGHADVCGCPTSGNNEFCDNCQGKINLDRQTGREALASEASVRDSGV
jgi:CDGSH-type Zn-finger protein